MYRFLFSLIFGLGLTHAALAADESQLGCIPTGSSTAKNECADLIPQPWAYSACDAYRTAAALADWCFAFGGTGDAQHCSVSTTFTDGNIPAVSENFMQIVHGCSPPSEFDTGWGVSVDDGSGGNTCWLDGPGYTNGILTKDFRQLTFGGKDGGTCTHNYTDYIWARRDRSLACPVGYYHYVDGNVNLCIRPISCPCPKLGNPTRVSDGQKVIWETDYPAISGGLLEYRRVYRSYGHFNPSELLLNVQFDGFWESNFDTRLYVLPSAQYPIPYVVSAPDGTVHYFDTTGKEVIHYGSAAETFALQYNGGGTLTGYVRTLSDETRQTFSTSGLLVAVDDTKSHHLSLAYNASGNLQTVTDERGRTLTFGYNAQNQRASVTFSDGQSVSYAYDINANLQTVTFPGGATRGYRYENQSFIHALTGITDENNVNYASYSYDSNGRVQDAVHAPNLANGTIDHYHFAYVADTNIPSALVSTTVTEPLGQSVTFNFQKVAGINSLSSLSGPCGGCDEKNKSVSYDTAGYIQSTTDFNNVTSTYVYNDLRGLPTQRVEASGKPEQRTTATTWNPTLRFPNQRTVANNAGTIESQENWAYNSLGQVSARCLVDLAVSGASSYVCGSSTNAPSGVRQWLYAYCEQADINAGTCPVIGLTKSVNGPRTDVSDITTYAYYQTTVLTDCTTLGGTCHYLGDLYTVTNALGQVTTTVSYDKIGRATRIQDANGVYTDLTYHPRGWLLTRTVRANANGTPNAALDATTTFAYDNVGNVTRVTQPDGTYLQYVYDDAHRLSDIYDSAAPANYLNGDHIHYVLDAVGNRTEERTYDPSGTLKRGLSRQYDQLNHLTALLNSGSVAVQSYANPAEAPPSGITYTNGYDGNGNAIYSIDGTSNHVGTEQQYDPLNRLVKTLQDHTGSASTHDTTTQYAYDTRNNLRSVTDPDNLVTSYSYDGLNNLTALDSPDTGSTSYSYDAAGNRTAQTDARSVTTQYQYDALNRLVAIIYPTSSLNVSYAYDQSNSTTGCAESYPIGRLTQMTDSSGTTTRCYDLRGNVIATMQSTSAIEMDTQYAYTLANRLQSITYLPAGDIVSYSRDDVGRIAAIDMAQNGAFLGQGAAQIPVVSSISYYPFGPSNVVTFGNGRTLAKAYDSDYAIDSVASSDPNGLLIDATVDVLGNLTAASDAFTAPAKTRGYQYDRLYRLTGANDASSASLEAYTYNQTGDRLSKSVNGGTAQTYSYGSPQTSHRLLSVAGTSRSYDDNGNTTQIGSASFSYDDRNRLVQAGTPTYSYNGRGERVMKNIATLPADAGTILAYAFSYSPAGQLLTERQQTSFCYVFHGNCSYVARWNAASEYIWADATLIATMQDSQVYYVETDQLGTPRRVVLPGDYYSDTADDVVMWSWDYFGGAFGEDAPNEDPADTGVPFTFNLRFPGQYFDSETGLNYNYFRDYEPGTGRYIESDPAGFVGGLSTYLYTAGNPVRAIDQFGLQSEEGPFDPGPNPSDPQPNARDPRVPWDPPAYGVPRKYCKPYFIVNHGTHVGGPLVLPLVKEDPPTGSGCELKVTCHYKGYFPYDWGNKDLMHATAKLEPVEADYEITILKNSCSCLR